MMTLGLMQTKYYLEDHIMKRSLLTKNIMAISLSSQLD